MIPESPKELKRTPGPVSAISVSSARVAITGSMLFIFLLALLHFIKSEIDPEWQPISEYALGRHGWLMTLAFLSMGTACFALFLTVRRQTKTIIGMIGFAFLLLSASGFLLAAIFPGDPALVSEDSLTTSGHFHSAGAALGGLIPFGLLFMTIALIKNIHWKKAKTSLWSITLIAWVADITITVAMAVYLPRNNGRLGPDVPIGWYNRFMIIAYAICILWMAATSVRMKRTA